MAGTVSSWWRRLLWLVAIWGLSVLGLGLAAGLLRLLMAMAGLHR